MPYMIAIDSGGTKTDTVLFDQTGHILHREVSLGCNPLDVGSEATRSRALEAIRRMTPRAPEPVSAIYAAIAGTYYYPSELFPPDWYAQIAVARVRVDDDGRSLVSSELSHEEDGCGLVCGTGCSIWVRKKGLEPIVHLGGWGYLLDSMGSGYTIGRDAAHAACQAVDGRGASTALVELIERELGKSLRWGLPELYAGGRRRIAALAYTVFQGARMGDKVSLDILDASAQQIAGLIWAADRYFDSPYPVVMGGGIVTSFPEYEAAIRQKAPANARPIVGQAPPVFGGAVEAMKDCGLAVDGAFRKTFLAEYANWTNHQ